MSTRHVRRQWASQGWCAGAMTLFLILALNLSVVQADTLATINAEDSDPATTLITHYYVSILEREPEPDGLAYWQGLVADKKAQGEDVKDVFRQMANFFFNSPEYLGRNTTDRQFITNLYLTFFQREPDDGGYAFWLDQLAQGMTRNQVMQGFLYSPEFTAFMEDTLGSIIAVALYPRIEFVSDQMLFFDAIGQSGNLQVRVFDAQGQEIPDAQVSWSSSSPGSVAVTPTGALSAQADAVANWSSSITLTATYAPLNLSAQAQAVMAVMAPNAVLVSSTQVLDISGDRAEVHQVISTRTAQTEALQVGQVVVTGDQAGVMVRILGVTLEANRVILTVEPAPITEAFEDIDVTVQSEPMRLNIQVIRDGVSSMTLRSLRNGKIVSQQALPPQVIDLSNLKCEGGLNLGANLDISALELQQDLIPRLSWRIENFELVDFLLLLEGQVSVTSGLRVTWGGGGSLSGQCAVKDVHIKLAALQWGPISIQPVLGTEFGVKLSVNATTSTEITLPRLNRSWQAKAGVRWTAGEGWQGIAESSAQSDLEDVNTSWNTDLDVTFGPYAKLNWNLDFNLGVGWLSRNLASVGFFGINGELYGKLGITPPLDPALKDYSGPTSELGVNMNAAIEFEASLFKGTLDKYVPFLTLANNLTFPVFAEQLVLWSNVKPTGNVACSPNCEDVLQDGSGKVTLNAYANTVATGTVEFWASRDNADALIKLAGPVSFTGGQGEAIYVPNENAEAGRYTVYPRLYMESSTSLPLTTENAQPIGAFTIGSGCIEGQIIQVNGVDRYRVVGSDCSVVADLVTGLEWQRCSGGQTWNASTQSCGGDSPNTVYTWDAAVTLTASGGFRLPTIEELRSLVYCSNTGVIGMYEDWPVSCGSDDVPFNTPAIVQEAFPMGRVWHYWWSSSVDANYPDFAWYVNFDGGFVHAYAKSTYGHVRLVRGGQSLVFLPSALATHQDPLLSPKAASALLASELPSTLQRLINDAQAPLSNPQTSTDGRVIVFATEAALLPEDNNGVSDIYRFDAARNQIQRLSVGLNGQSANAASHSPRLDASGQRVVFLSAATNLTLGLPGKADQLYLHDDARPSLMRLSETPLGEPADAAITHLLLDAAGEQVVYRSAAANLDAGPGLYRHNLRTGLREVIAVDDQGQPDPHADAPAADATLALIAYQRPVPEGPVADALQIYFYNQARNLTERVSPFFNEYGQAVANCCASVSPDGAYLAWREATVDGERRLILLDRATGRWIPQPWPQDAALAEQAPVFGNANRELWWMNPLQGPGSEPVLHRLPNLLMEAAK